MAKIIALLNDPNKRTRERAYYPVQDEIAKRGRVIMGLMTSFDWHNNPRSFFFRLSRYKFVSKMLSGYNRVAEIGCGDGFMSELVRREVKQLDLFDFDPVMCAESGAREFDISKGRLPGLVYDAIYLLDVFEHIKDEKILLNNLTTSLRFSGGMLIVGTPSLESQKYASDISKAGHVNVKTGDQLRELMQTKFSNVMMFGMNDEVVHTGYFPMCHYLFAVCTGSK